MIAWKLSVDFNEQNHLFYNNIKTDYIIVAFICSCGHVDFVLKHSSQEVGYICSECENNKFYDANFALNNIQHFLNKNWDLDLGFESCIKVDKSSIRSLYITKVPNNINFMNKKVSCSKKIVYELRLDNKGELEESYSLRLNNEIHTGLKNNLIKHINKFNTFNLPSSYVKEHTLSSAKFFLKNRNLKEFDFYYWRDVSSFKDREVNIKNALKLVSGNRKEKSVKRAIYQNYLYQLNSFKEFDSTFIEVFCRHIEDVNILSKLIELKVFVSKQESVLKIDLEELVIFLKKHYTEIQIFRFFSNLKYKSNEYIFRDLINEFVYSKDIIERKFKKIPLKVQNLHDEFVDFSREKRYKKIMDQTLQYSKEVYSKCSKIDGYQVKVPLSGRELFQWADTLHNCLAAYYELIEDRQSVIYGFFKGNILLFAVEISDDTLIQASEKYNADLTLDNQVVLTNWYQRHFEQTFKPAV